jgi:hypothetical protein
LLLQPLPSPPSWRGSIPPLDYGLVAVACSISLLCYDCLDAIWAVQHDLWHILCNSYLEDLYFIGWSMRCDMLLCSWCMSRCILLPRSLLLVLIQHVCESTRGGWCVLDGVTR